MTQTLTMQPTRRLTLSYRKFLNGFLWVFISLGSFSFIEPSPYDILSLLIVPAWFVGGFKVHRSVVPLVAILFTYNLGGFFSLVPYFNESDPKIWIFYSVYLGLTGIFFAIFFAEDTEKRVGICIKAYLVSCLFAAVLAVIGYFDIGDTAKWFSPEGRAMGPFKDPNVMGSYTIFGYIYLLQLLLLGKAKRPLLAFTGALVLLLSIFLSFSRGSWGATVMATLLTTVFCYVTANERRLRKRIVIIFVVMVGFAALALVAALSIDQIGDMLGQRAKLEQEYDGGVTGRFGNQLRSIPMLLDRPNGFGPYRFNLWFQLEPHNSYIGAFSAYGWLGGFSFFTLVAMTAFIGFRLCLKRSPYMYHAQIVWTALFMFFLQAFQIDIDHWRFVYLMLGTLWGLEGARKRWIFTR